MKIILKQENGITMVSLVVTIIILIILTSVLVFNTQDSIYIKRLNNLYNDIELLREKVSSYYNEYGEIPATIKYTNISSLKNILSAKNDIGDFYVIDLEAMQGITLNYGKDYEKIKNDESNVNNYTDLYIINKNSHNIFYVNGIEVKNKTEIKKYYTDYTNPDETAVDMRYVDGIIIPEGYYYIGKTKDDNGNEYMVISDNREDSVDITKTNQYTWTKQASKIEEVPSNITLENNQNEYQFIKSVNIYKGYFKNTEEKVKYIVINEEIWSEAYTKDTEYVDKNGDTVTIPEGFKISMAETMNTVSNGLVVKDANDNEWVWVEVPDNIFITANNDTDYEKIEKDLINYAKDYRKGNSTQNLDWKDEWYEGCGIEDSDTYIAMYNKMLSSIYTNGGFWISRYEIGDATATESNTARTSISGISGKAVSQANQIPYNLVTCSDAQTLAGGMTTNNNKISSLLFGIQWDLVCKFLEENSDLEFADISENSTNWGNYKDSTIVITNNNAKQYNSSIWSSITGKKIENNSILLTTKSSEQTRIMNIYDFAGNEWELTLEYAVLNSPTVRRGGNYNSNGYEIPISSRSAIQFGGKNEYIGFRVSLY